MKMNRIIAGVSFALLCLIGLSVTGDVVPPQVFVPATPMQISSGNGSGYSWISKFGENPDIDSGGGFEVIWDAGGDYVAPTTARLHDIASDNAADVGVVVSSGVATGGSDVTLVDTSATFSSDGVIAGDFLLNDDDVTIGRVLSVLSETAVFVSRMADPRGGLSIGVNHVGSNYRIVSPNGTGAGIMHLSGVDATAAEFQSEFVVINGASNVATAKSYFMIHRCRIFVAGATNGAVGVITATAQTDGTVTCQVVDGNNQSEMAVFMVPRNYTAYLTSWWASISSRNTSSSVVKLRAGELNGVSYVTQVRALNSSGSGNFIYVYPIPTTIPGGASIFIEADSSANNTALSGGFELTLIRNR